MIVVMRKGLYLLLKDDWQACQRNVVQLKMAQLLEKVPVLEAENENKETKRLKKGGENLFSIEIVRKLLPGKGRMGKRRVPESHLYFLIGQLF